MTMLVQSLCRGVWLKKKKEREIISKNYAGKEEIQGINSLPLFLPPFFSQSNTQYPIYRPSFFVTVAVLFFFRFLWFFFLFCVMIRWLLHPSCAPNFWLPPRLSPWQVVDSTPEALTVQCESVIQRAASKYFGSFLSIHHPSPLPACAIASLTAVEQASLIALWDPCQETPRQLPSIYV